MRLVLKLVGLLLLGFGVAQATQCPAPYFASHSKWRCDEMIAEYRKIPDLALPIILDTPGSNQSCLDKIYKMPNLKAIEFHVINETCFPERGRRCQKHEVAYGESIRSWTEKIRKKDLGLVRRIQAAAARTAAQIKKVRADTEVFVSPLLESNLGPKEGSIVMEIFRPYLQERFTTLVWNPVRDVGRIEGTYYELHGYNPNLSAPCIYNNDGSIFEPVQASYYIGKYPQCRMSCAWFLGDNCLDKRYEKREGFIEIPSRVGCNRQREFKEIAAAVMKVTGPAPSATPNPIDLKGCREVLKVPDGEKSGLVWKQMDPAEGGRTCGGKPTNGATVLTNFGKASRKLEAYRNGKRIESFCFGADYKHDPAGKQRKIWRSNKDLPDFPAGTVLKSDKGACWPLRNPAERID